MHLYQSYPRGKLQEQGEYLVGMTVAHFHAQDLIGMQAMGNFPYPSTYILNGGGEMPAYPVRVACESLAKEKMSTDELFSGFADSLGIFYNYTKVCAQIPDRLLTCTKTACEGTYNVSMSVQQPAGSSAGLDFLLGIRYIKKRRLIACMYPLGTSCVVLAALCGSDSSYLQSGVLHAGCRVL